MDLNLVFLRQQVERSLADAADTSSAREEHLRLAREYELEIERKSEGRIAFRDHPQASISSHSQEEARR